MKKIAMKISHILLLRITPILLGIIVVGLTFIKLNYGTGKTYPDLGIENPKGNQNLEKLI